MDILKGLFKEFGWFIWGLVGLGFIWFFTGGIYSEDARGGAYIKPLAPIDTGETYGNYFEARTDRRNETLDLPESPATLLRSAEAKIEDFFNRSQEAKRIHATSVKGPGLSFDGFAAVKAEKVNDEYLRIVSSAKAPAPITLTGLLLSGAAYGVNIPIPKSAELPILGTTVIRKDIVMPPGGRALVSTGRSPIGTSFRVNMCTGFLDQFQDFTPDLRKDCPEPEIMLERANLSPDASCKAFVKKIPRCRVWSEPFPANISDSCKAFVTEKINYNSCVLVHNEDKGFYKNEWRVFLDGRDELWRDKNEIIRLMDAKGNVLDALTY